MALLAGATLACRADMGGEKTVVIAAGGDADAMIPMVGAQAQARAMTEIMFEKLADLGDSLNTVGDYGYVPRLATSWSWSGDSMAVTFALDPRATWHDGRPVRANDVVFAFQLATDPKVGAATGADLRGVVDSVTAPDSTHATAWFKARRPDQFHQLVYNLIPLPEHLLAAVNRDSLRVSSFAAQPVGNGPFKLAIRVPRERTEYVANDNFARGRPRLDRVIVTIHQGGPAAARAVIAGDADFVERLSPDDAAEVSKSPELRLIPAGSVEYGVVSFNFKRPKGSAPHPVFGDLRVRQAVTMAVDRATLVQSVYGSLGRVALGPFVRAQWSADTTLSQLPFDTAAAGAMLDSAGWRRGTGGMRARAGAPLRFVLAVAATNRERPRLAELMQQQLKQQGVDMQIQLLDGAAMQARLSAHDFDAAMFTWRTTPSPSGAQSAWGTVGYAPGSPYNAGGYSSAVFDANVDSALKERDRTRARAQFRVAYQAAITDAPAIWLYEPSVVAGAAARVSTGTLRQDAWWASLERWDVTGPPRRRAGTAPDSAPR